MMEAILIDGDFSGMGNRPDSVYVKHIPKEGETYEIEIVKVNGKDAVLITNQDCGKHPDGKPITFKKQRFAIIGGPEEKEIHKTNLQQWQ